MKSLFAVLAFSVLVVGQGSAKMDVSSRPKTEISGKTFRTASTCLPATSVSELNINNVRAMLHNGGDMWWDLVGTARYEVPKVTDPANARHSLFAGSLWIGGIDNSGLLRIASQTYRQGGNDFWPGPLRVNGSGDTEQDICQKWDKHFKINKSEIDDFLATGEISQGIANWPGTNEDAAAGDFEKFLAPFHDENNDMEYDPEEGDYPIVSIVSCGKAKEILPDQFVWWVINDNGDVHTASGGQPVGVEVQMMAFAFTTSNQVNDMTFYQEKVYNRSTLSLNDTYIGQWTDADLGNAFDDFAGCDTVRGLAFVYNSDNDDSPLNVGYGSEAPAIGIDFFQGPISDPNDGIDNDKDGQLDEVVTLPDGDMINERIPMVKFVYYNNDGTVIGNPGRSTEFYNYLIGRWKDNTFMVDDRAAAVTDGYANPGDLPGNPTDFMFPDYPGFACSFEKYSGGNQYGEWGETENGISQGVPADKRLLQSAGPFTLQPGAFNEIIVGVVWARDEANTYDANHFGSVCKMYQADDIAQALFDACFDLLDGPAAPDLVVQEYDKELILSWNYSKVSSNNYYENYSERDPVLCNANPANCTFNFEGYMVYQLKDGTVTTGDLEDPTKARIIAQCDIKNGVSTIVNREALNVGGVDEPVITDKIMVNGKDEGLFHSLSLKTDAFAEGSDDKLVNYRTYYFTVIAYAFNDTAADGRKFIRGNDNLSTYEAIPHKTEFERFGTILNSAYGSGPEITRISGRGNNGNFLALSEATENAIINSPYTINEPTYLGGAGPLDIKIVNPKLVLPKVYELEVTCDSLVSVDSDTVSEELDKGNYSDWMVYDVTNQGQRDLIYQSFWRADTANVGAYYDRRMNGQEKLIIENAPATAGIDHGFSIAVDASTYAGDTTEALSGYIGSEQIFANTTKKWLSGVGDQDNFPLYNWIRSGAVPRDPSSGNPDIDRIDFYGWDVNNDPAQNIVKTLRWYDKNESFENVLNGTWSPYVLAASFHTTKDLIAPGVKIFFHDGYLGLDYASPLRPNPQIEMDPANVITLDKLPNVDIVITTDQTKWSRCVVVETSPSKNLGSGSWIMTAKWRNNMSIQDVQNCTNVTTPSMGTTDYGMSYFPGYAIDLDSGRRLNVFFGESTWHKSDNGDDMLWNPSSSIGNDGRVVGGRHYVYVSNTTYDECQSIAATLRVPTTATLPGLGSELANRPLQFDDGGNSYDIAPAWQDVAWTNIPITSQQQYVFRCYKDIPSDVRMQLRVTQPMECGARFRFDMRKYAVSINDATVAEESMDDINIVPNPYYGRSGVGRGRYETDQLDTRVKITNLPQKCTIRIFTLNGALVRTYRKDSDEPDQEWDLKNDFGVPIASGLYILHIDGESLGEKILKFFCVVPQPDLNAY